MGITDLFSKRQKRLRGDMPDVYRYGDLPKPLRVQIVHIWYDAFGSLDEYESSAPAAFECIRNALCREYGLFRLRDGDADHFTEVSNFLIGTDDVEKVLDVVEISFSWIDQNVRGSSLQYPRARISPDEAIEELNARFKEHGVGYQYVSGQIIRIDSELIHAEVVKPALRFLAKGMYRGANQEFLSAHAHYREGKHKECLVDCGKALESTLKAICEKRKWPFSPKDTVKKLIAIVLKQGLIPAYMETHFAGLRSTLEAGVPTVRNKLGGHGQGTVPTVVPESIVSYALHLTATTILFLANADSEAR